MANSMLSRVKDLLEKSLVPGVSCVHLIPDSPPLIRYMGSLLPVSGPAWEAKNIEELAIGFLTGEQLNRLEDSGDIDFSMIVPEIGRVQISIYRQNGTIAMVLHAAPRFCPSFAELHLPDRLFKDLCSRRRGLILITGPANSGKITTLNAMVDYINHAYPCAITTVESPIQYSHQHATGVVDQREVGRDVDTTEEGLEEALRIRPDVLVIDQIENDEAIKKAVYGAMSGRLLLATIHGVDAIGLLARLVNAFDEDRHQMAHSLLAAGLVAIINQRLLKSKDKESFLPAVEILINNNKIRPMLSEDYRRVTRALLEDSGPEGMRTLDQDLFRLVQEDLVTPEEAVKHSMNPEDLSEHLSVLSKCHPAHYQSAS